jgi:hypothetical protein
LAEISNNYESFCPQNLMVEYVQMVCSQLQLMLPVVWQKSTIIMEYVHAGQNQRPIKRTPFAPSCEEWAVLANKMHDIEPLT